MRASYRRIVECVAGTFAGEFAAWMITMGFHSPAVICAFIPVVAPLIPRYITSRCWLHTTLIALVVLLAYDLAELNAQGIAKLLPEWVIDILIDCAAALVETAAAFPLLLVAELDSLVEESPSLAGPVRSKLRTLGHDGGSA